MPSLKAGAGSCKKLGTSPTQHKCHITCATSVLASACRAAASQESLSTVPAMPCWPLGAGLQLSPGRSPWGPGRPGPPSLRCIRLRRVARAVALQGAHAHARILQPKRITTPLSFVTGPTLCTQQHGMACIRQDACELACNNKGSCMPVNAGTSMAANKTMNPCSRWGVHVSTHLQCRTAPTETP